jgi:carboxypeptidase-like protein
MPKASLRENLNLSRTLIAQSLFLLFGILLCFQTSKGQTWDISGKIIDDLTRDPIDYAYVTAVGDTAFALTDAEGNYTIRISKAATEISVLADGYTKFTIPVKNIIKFTLNIELTANVSQLAKEARRNEERCDRRKNNW